MFGCSCVNQKRDCLIVAQLRVFDTCLEFALPSRLCVEWPRGDLLRRGLRKFQLKTNQEVNE